MRYLLPTAAAAAAVLAISTTPIAAAKPHHQPQRVKSHISLHLSSHAALDGRTVVVEGRVRPRPAGSRRVKLVLRGPDAAVVRTATAARGGFRTSISPALAGNYAVRAFLAHGARARAGASPARRLTAYRQAGASYYGPGLYGNGVACGGTLMPGTLGVAHKTLPCGTKVKLRYRGRTVTVPVIDRGPYVAGRDYDLTTATKLRLGFPGVGTVLANR
jgi:rare lipoprotein A